MTAAEDWVRLRGYDALLRGQQHRHRPLSSIQHDEVGQLVRVEVPEGCGKKLEDVRVLAEHGRAHVRQVRGLGHGHAEYHSDEELSHS